MTESAEEVDMRSAIETGATSTEAAVVFDEVGKTFVTRAGTHVEALSGISGEVAKGEFVSIIGPSGCGKSTLLEMLAGLTRVTSGRILVGGEEVVRPRQDFGIVFQTDSTLPWRTARENVEFPLEIRGGVRDKGERKQRALDALGKVGLADFADSRPAELSGGMRQRVAIARGLVTQPHLLLMDEPFGALDQQTRTIIGEQLRALTRQLAQTVIFVTHDINEALLLSNEVWLLSARPARVRSRVRVPWADQEMGAADVMRSPEYGALSSQLWEELREEADLAMNGRASD